MPGDRELYESEMNAGHEAAWSQDWSKASNHYGRALAEFPEDEEATLNLGFSLLSADRLDEAFKVYSRAHQLAPEDPIPLEKSADVLEKMGRLREAAQQYAAVAEVYLKQRDIEKAIETWERATELTPGLVAIHARLAQAYRKIGNKRRAMYQYLMTAYNLSSMGDVERAKDAAQRALALNKKSVEAQNALQALESGARVQMPKPYDDSHEPKPKSTGSLDWGDIDLDDPVDEKESDPLGPMGEAMNDALSSMAGHIMMSGGFEAGGVEALQAMELQRQGLHSEAISSYREAAQQMKHPALSMNLGALLLLSEEPDAAIGSLTDAAVESSLRAGAYHALGQAYVNLDQHKKGLLFLIQSAQMADMANTTTEEDKSMSEALYSDLRETVERRGDNDQIFVAVCRRLQRMLSGNEWERRLADTRYQMVEAGRDGGGERILEFLAEDIAEGVTDSVGLIDRYIRQGMYTLALDEAQYAIEKSPTYLPVHVRMAEVMMLEGRVRQAINKYNTVAKTYRSRGENGRAASILYEVLETAPLDVAVRTNLIGLLESEERWEDALEQYVELGTTYRQMGNLDAGRTTFANAEKLADRVNVDVATQLRIKHAIADIDQLKMDIRRALRVYEDIVNLSPGDDKARKALVEMNLQMGNQIEAIKQLDGLLRLYAKNKQVKRILQLLQSLVSSYPENSGLRSRLAAIYRQLKRNDEAVEQLEQLAHLQLDAGLTNDACETIRQIIKLNPPNVDEFEQSLTQLGC